jgi:hypothetical protein
MKLCKAPLQRTWKTLSSDVLDQIIGQTAKIGGGCTASSISRLFDAFVLTLVAKAIPEKNSQHMRKFIESYISEKLMRCTSQKCASHLRIIPQRDKMVLNPLFFEFVQNTSLKGQL